MSSTIETADGRFRTAGSPDKKKDLLWTTRLKIALDAARGLQYMHGTCFPPVIHRDFKSSNVLLARDYTAKVRLSFQLS